jgi:hypothetical protein
VSTTCGCFRPFNRRLENGSRCVMLLPDADMERKVAEFITELEKQAPRRTPLCCSISRSHPIRSWRCGGQI